MLPFMIINIIHNGHMVAPTNSIMCVTVWYKLQVGCIPILQFA